MSEVTPWRCRRSCAWTSPSIAARSTSRPPMCRAWTASPIKISPGFFDNPKLGLPSTQRHDGAALARTGLVDALLLDNGYLTDVRTAAAGAVAAKHLSRPTDSQRGAIFGAGVQAGCSSGLPWCGRSTACGSGPATAPRREAFWRRAGARQRLGFALRRASTQAAMAGADIIVTCTPSGRAVDPARRLAAPGQHITAMGSDAEHKNELDPAVLAQVDLYVADSLSPDAPPRRAASRHRRRHRGSRRRLRASRSAQVMAGNGPVAPMRRITSCDLTGTGPRTRPSPIWPASVRARPARVFSSAVNRFFHPSVIYQRACACLR
jgi:ornithine cyclodeaminase/alanine dehydrogenase-like protein (mu-crystallin family)